MRPLLASSLMVLVLGGVAIADVHAQTDDPSDTDQREGEPVDAGETDEQLPSALDMLEEDDEDPEDESETRPDESETRPDESEEPTDDPPSRAETEDGMMELSPRPDEQLVILELSVPEFVLTRDLTGYWDPEAERLWIPLWLFAEMVEFPIEIDLEDGTAEGWFYSEDRTFSLDLTDETVTIAGETRPLEPGDVERHHDDLYVDIELLARWFDFEWDFDFSLMNLDVDPEVPFPPQQRRIREERREQIRELVVDDEPAHGIAPNPYQLWSRPVHEFGVDVGFPTSREVDERDNRRRTVPNSNRYQIRGAGDLLYMNANWSIAGSERDPIRRTRLRFDRKDPDGELLGDAAATEIRAGDVRSRSLPMVARSDEGRGAEVSSFPLTRPSTFDRTTVSGPREPGWEVELYRNDELIDYHEGTDDDYYHFEDVPLLFGTNEIRVVQHGPHGQTHEDVYRYNVGRDMISPGEDHYRVSASQHNTDMLPLGSTRRETAVDGRPRGVVEYERGLTERVAVAGRANTLPERDTGDQRFFSAVGLRGAFDRAYTTLDMTVSDGLMLHATGQTRIGDVNVSAESAQLFGGFTSERIPYDTNPLRNRSRLRLNGVVPVDDTGLPFSVRLEHDYRSQLGHRTRISNRVTRRIRDYILMHNLRFQRSHRGVSWFNGTFGARQRGHQLSPRFSASYRFGGGSRTGLRSYRAGIDWQLRDDLEFRGTFHHDFDDRHDYTLRGGLNYRRPNFSLEGNIGLSYSGGVSVGVGVEWGIAHNPETQQWEPTDRRLTSAGRVVPRVFLDKSQNGSFDDTADEPLEGVRFDVDNAEQDIETNERGVAVLPDVRPHDYADIEVRRDSLHDPFLVPEPEGHSVVPRPGTEPRLDFPVVMTGEVDGTVRLVRDDEVLPAQNVPIQLLDEDGEVVDETTTAFDGFYLFDFVPPGEYSVRPDPERIAARNLEQPDPVEVEIEVDGTIVVGQDFELTR